jgi:hypothetical protein
MLNFKEYLTPAERSKKDMSYTDIGHTGPYVLWTYEKGNLVTKEYPADAGRGHIEDFPYVALRAFTGRYDINTRMLSIAAPASRHLKPEEIHYIIQHELLPKLRQKFDIKDYKFFK